MLGPGQEKAVEVARRFRNSIRRLPAAGLLLLAVLSLAGCYEVRDEVIPARLGEVIPFTSERADFEGGGKILFSRASFNNDYRFRDIGDDGAERLGTFRAMRLKGNIYVVQARYDDEPQYLILFYAINAENFQVVDPVGTDLKAFAAGFGVEYHDDEFAEGFTGEPEKILAMLQALGSAEFKP